MNSALVNKTVTEELSSVIAKQEETATPQAPKQKPKRVVSKKVKTVVLKKAPSRATSVRSFQAGGEPGPEALSMEGDEKQFKSLADFEPLNELTAIVKGGNQDKVFLTRKEKKCLEEITHLASKTRVPLDDRQMHFFNKDVEKFSAKITLPEITAISEKEYKDAADKLKESASKIIATELSSLGSYLTDLKSLIAKREIAWANTTDNDYAQKVEIARLKNEVNHLRVVCSKRQSELGDKDRAIAEKDKEISRLQKLIQKLKMGILQLEKDSSRSDDEGGMRRNQRSTNLKMMEDLLLSEVARVQRGTCLRPAESRPVKIGSAPEPRKNQGPAALLANALYKARNAGSHVNF